MSYLFVFLMVFIEEQMFLMNSISFFFFFPYMDSTFGIKKSLPNLGLHRFSLLEHAQQTQPADHI